MPRAKKVRKTKTKSDAAKEAASAEKATPLNPSSSAAAVTVATAAAPDPSGGGNEGKNDPMIVFSDVVVVDVKAQSAEEFDADPETYQASSAAAAAAAPTPVFASDHPAGSAAGAGKPIDKRKSKKPKRKAVAEPEVKSGLDVDEFAKQWEAELESLEKISSAPVPAVPAAASAAGSSEAAAVVKSTEPVSALVARIRKEKKLNEVRAAVDKKVETKGKLEDKALTTKEDGTARKVAEHRKSGAQHAVISDSYIHDSFLLHLQFRAFNAKYDQITGISRNAVYALRDAADEFVVQLASAVKPSAEAIRSRKSGKEVQFQTKPQFVSAVKTLGHAAPNTEAFHVYDDVKIVPTDPEERRSFYALKKTERDARLAQQCKEAEATAIRIARGLTEEAYTAARALVEAHFDDTEPEESEAAK